MSAVTLREAQFDQQDLRGVWDLQRRLFEQNNWCSFGEFVEMSRVRWLDNPARTPDHVFGWVLDSPTDGIVGFVGLIPVRMKIGGREIVGGCGSGYCVMPTYRAYSLSLYKQLMDWGDTHFLVTTTANQMSSKLNRILGLNQIPVLNFDRFFLWLIRPEVLVNRALDNSAWQNWSPLVARAPFSWLLKVVARVRFARHRRLRFSGETLPVETVKEFTEDFTQFWEGHKNQYGITMVRDKKFLQWRYLEMPPVLGVNHIFACRDNGRLGGYLVMVEINPRQKFCAPKRFRVIDVFYDRSRPDVFYSLMNRAFESAKVQGCTAFEVASMSQELTDLLQVQRPYVQQAESCPYWYKTSKEDLAELCRTEVWWPSGADGDSNL